MSDDVKRYTARNGDWVGWYIPEAEGLADPTELVLASDYDTLRGAMRAQDEREREAGIECGVLYEEYGCDWPGAVAAVVAEQVETIRGLREAMKKAREYHYHGERIGCPCDVCKTLDAALSEKLVDKDE